MIQREGCPASLNALARQGGGGVSLPQSHQLVCGQCQNTEHQVSHRFGVPLDHEVVFAELILESVASEGSFLRKGKPQIVAGHGLSSSARSVLPWSSDPIRPWPRRRSPTRPVQKGGRHTPHQVTFVNSSMRTHSSVWMTFSSFGVSASASFFNSGSSSCWITFHRCMISSRRVASIWQA